MMKTSVATLAVSLIALGASPALSAPVTHKVTTVNGLKVDKYIWKDSKGRQRSVSLKKEGNGNPGHGGYAVQMTYKTKIGGVWKTIVVNASQTSDGGFGYFVSHERYRDFVGGGNNTIARKVFKTDDSPLSLRFPVVGKKVTLQNTNAIAHQFKLNYPRYGTIDPIPKDPNTGNDVELTPTDKSKLKLYTLPVTVTWVFQNGTDYPRIRTKVSLSDLPGPDRVNFDLRGPYGVMVFDDGANSTIKRVMWGDRFHFTSTGGNLTRNSTWTWNQANDGARYNALIAGNYEMGLLEPKTYAASTWVDGYAEARSKTSVTYKNGNGCPYQDQLVPCDWEWPYQSAQYSLPYDNPNGTTNFKKMAWGSAAFWGTGPSLPRVYDTPNSYRDFNGFPASGSIIYNVCVVLGRTTADGLTKSVAVGPQYNCATAAVN